jgi:large subunit ribosomal protein L21
VVKIWGFDGSGGILVYAIVRTGGKQYRVQPGDVIRLERLTAAVGTKVTLEDVLFVVGDGGVQVGSPRLESAAVVGTVLEEGRGNKIRVFKYKKRKHYRRTRGHRQTYTALRIDTVRA